MVKQKDPFWSYAVDLTTGRFLCNFCAKEFSGGASRIKYHLSGDRGWGIEICEKVPTDIQLKAHQVIGVPPKRAKTMATSTSVLEDESTPNSLTLQIPNSKRKDKNEVDIPFAKYVITHKFLSDVIGSTIFTNFVNGVAEYGFGYKLPSSSVLESQLIPNIEKEVKEYVQNVMAFSTERGCTLYFARDASIFAYTPNGVVCIGSTSFSVELEERDLYSPIEIISSAIKKIGAANVVQVIMSSPADLIVNNLQSRFPSILVTHCPFAAIDIVFYSIFPKPSVRNVLNGAIMIDHFIYKYKIKVQGQYDLGDYWNLHKLTPLSVTDKRYLWGLHKLISLLEVESELRDLQESIVTLSSERWKLILEEGKIYFEDAKYIDFVIHCKEFWSKGKSLASFLRPVLEVFYLMVDNGSSFGQLYEAMEKVAVAERECCEEVFNGGSFRPELRKYASVIFQPIYVVAAFLDPTYMCRRELKEDPKMTDGINYVLNHLVREDEKEIFTKQVEQYRQILSEMSIDEVMKQVEQCRYILSEMSIDEGTTRLDTSQARIWWNFYGSHLHVLKRYAVRILNQPCSFSFCPAYQLHMGFSRDQVFAINTMLMERYKSPETQMSKSTVSNKQYEGKYRRLISWFKENFLDIKDDPSLWLEGYMEFDIWSDDEY